MPGTYLPLGDVDAHPSVSGDRDLRRNTERGSDEDRYSSHRRLSATEQLQRQASGVPWTDEFAHNIHEAPTAADLAQSYEDERIIRKSAALCVQRWYRKQVLKYSTFGPMIFTSKDGKLSDFGRLGETMHVKHARA